MRGPSKKQSSSLSFKTIYSFHLVKILSKVEKFIVEFKRKRVQRLSQRSFNLVEIQPTLNNKVLKKKKFYMLR